MQPFMESKRCVEGSGKLDRKENQESRAKGWANRESTPMVKILKTKVLVFPSSLGKVMLLGQEGSSFVMGIGDTVIQTNIKS